MKKGSITIFSLLSMILIASTLFALLEAGRFYEIRRMAQIQTQVALESVFAEYNTYLWEEYHLLVCKQAEVANDLETFGNARIIEDGIGTNFYQFQVEQTNLEEYTRLTDGDGKALIHAVAGYMEKYVLYETAKSIYNQYEGINEIKNNSDFDFSDIEKALEELKNSDDSVSTTKNIDEALETKENEGYREKFQYESNNPLEAIQRIKKIGLLSLVIKDTNQLSEGKIDTVNRLSDRQLPEDSNSILEEIDWYDRVLFQQYLLTYMSNYTEEKEHALKYELEYLLAGKGTEIENLKSTVNMLLSLREAANFLYLSNNPVKVEQARLLAVSIVGATLNPVLVGLVKTAILAAWAFAESVLDIRTLLSGGKIALLKSDTSWTMDLDSITTINEGYAMAKDCSSGLSYKEYLGILLLLQQETEMAKRAMDVQEFTLWNRYNDTSIRLEEWILDVKASVTYRYEPVFFSIHKVLPSWKYEVTTCEEFKY